MKDKTNIHSIPNVEKDEIEQATHDHLTLPLTGLLKTALCRLMKGNES